MNFLNPPTQGVALGYVLPALQAANSIARRNPNRSGQQPGSVAVSGEEGHAVSVTESAAGG
jgi:hypothetical protein